MLPRSLRAELVADEGDDGDVIAEFLADLLEQGVHRDVGILNKSLVQQAGLGVQGLQLAGKNLFQQVFGLAFLDELLLGDFLFLSHEGGVQAVGADALGSGGGNVQGQVLGKSLERVRLDGFFLAGLDRQQNANLAAHVDVGDHSAGAVHREAGELAQSHVFTDGAAHGLDVFFRSAFGHGNLEGFLQRGGLGIHESLGNIVHQALELVALGAEVRFTVEFKDDAGAAAGSHGGADHAFLGIAVSLGGSLGNALFAKILHSGFHVAVAFVEGFLAIHHAGVRFVAEGLDESCSNFCHSVSVLSKWVGLGFGGSALAFVDGLDNAVKDQTDGTDGVVVAGNREIDFLRVGVGVNQNADGNVQTVGFADGDVFMIGADGYHGVRSAAHVADALKVAFQLLAFAVQSGQFLLGHALEFRGLFNPFKVGKAFDALADRAHVGEHAAQPAMVDVVLTSGFRGFADGFLGLALAADEEDLLVAACQIGQEGASLVQAFFRFFKVDDMDTGLVLEKVLLHAGVPFAGLVAQMNTGFNHLVNQIINHICM